MNLQFIHIGFLHSFVIIPECRRRRRVAHDLRPFVCPPLSVHPVGDESYREGNSCSALEGIPFNSKTNSSTGWRGPGFHNESVRDFHPDSCLWTPIILDGIVIQCVIPGQRRRSHSFITTELPERGGDRRSGRKKNPHILSFSLVPIIYSCT